MKHSAGKYTLHFTQIPPFVRTSGDVDDSICRMDFFLLLEYVHLYFAWCLKIVIPFISVFSSPDMHMIWGPFGGFIVSLQIVLYMFLF